MSDNNNGRESTWPTSAHVTDSLKHGSIAFIIAAKVRSVLKSINAPPFLYLRSLLVTPWPFLQFLYFFISFIRRLTRSCKTGKSNRGQLTFAQSRGERHTIRLYTGNESEM